VLTGSYHNYFRIYDTENLSDVVLQADKSAFKVKKGAVPPGKSPAGKNGRPLREAMQMDTLDFNKKILHASWHPRENTIAVSHTCRHGMTAADDASPDCRDKQPLHLQRGVVSVEISHHDVRSLTSDSLPTRALLWVALFILGAGDRVWCMSVDNGQRACVEKREAIQ
jgi:hypothetical protein